MKKFNAGDIIHSLSLEYKLGVTIPCYTEKVNKIQEILNVYETEIEGLKRNLDAAYNEIADLKCKAKKTYTPDVCV